MHLYRWIRIALCQILLLILARANEEFGLRLFKRNLRLQARDGEEVARAVSDLLRGESVHLKNAWHPKLYSIGRKLKTRRRDTDDDVSFPAERERFSDQ